MDKAAPEFDEKVQHGKILSKNVPVKGYSLFVFNGRDFYLSFGYLASRVIIVDL
jgi:hypothetical protein